ncbi:MAG: hypothetical protein Ct9H300mP2_2160 [Candidatus Neomarinimicrobiota bacterium]|nr:MAG: hypothetical protein Ct9H300mP2_2160 [Candidatus Neomarinimicrobiota bacterium]
MIDDKTGYIFFKTLFCTTEKEGRTALEKLIIMDSTV